MTATEPPTLKEIRVPLREFLAVVGDVLGMIPEDLLAPDAATWHWDLIRRHVRELKVHLAEARFAPDVLTTFYEPGGDEEAEVSEGYRQAIEASRLYDALGLATRGTYALIGFFVNVGVPDVDSEKVADVVAGLQEVGRRIREMQYRMEGLPDGIRVIEG